MSISDILRHKQTGGNGGEVATIAPTESVTALVTALAARNVGALVVVDERGVIGIVSERDVVRRLADKGSAVLDSTVGEIMTSSVLTCTGDDAVEEIAATMTQRRIRHMPVLENGNLIGIVSIGDVVSSRIRELEHVRGQLEQYIAG